MRLRLPLLLGHLELRSRLRRHARIEVLGHNARQRPEAVPHSLQYKAVHHVQQEAVYGAVDKQQGEQKAGHGGGRRGTSGADRG